MAVVDVVDRGAPTPVPLPRQYVVASLLLLLGESPAHGYELVARLGDLGVAGTDRASHYRLLRAMEGDGLVTSLWEHSATGPARRVYQLAPAGTAELHDRARTLRTGHQCLERYLDRYDVLTGAAADGAA